MGLRFLDAKECAKYLGCSDKHWYALVNNDPQAPQPVIKGESEKGKRYSRWLYHEVQRYMRVLIKENRIGYRKEDAA